MADNDKKDLDELSNEKLNAMFAPLPYRETDPMEKRHQLGYFIIGVFVIGFFLYMAFK